MLDLRRAVSWHRRKLAVLAAVAAVLATVAAALPASPPTAQVVRAAVELRAGGILRADQLRVDHLPVAALPEGAMPSMTELVGRTVVVAAPAGQVLTEHSTISGAPLPPGRVLAPLRLSDADVVSLLTAGDRVDVLSADGERGSAVVVARQARVVTVPQVDDEGGVAPAPSAGGGGLLLVDVDVPTALALAHAAVADRLSVVLH